MKPSPPQWIVVRLGEDFNWWLESTSAETDRPAATTGILDPRQVAHLAQALTDYQPYGLRPEQLRAAFQMFALESEIAEGRLRLMPVDQAFGDEASELFALPVLDEDGAGAFADLLDALTTAQLRKLNATHHYAQPCTADEMDDELTAIDSDRYFSAEVIHAFDEINEILEWSPAEWDDAKS